MGGLNGGSRRAEGGAVSEPSAGAAAGGAEADICDSDGRQPGIAQAAVSQLRCGQQSQGAWSAASAAAAPWHGRSGAASGGEGASAVRWSASLVIVPAPTAIPETTRHRARTTRRVQRERERRRMGSSVVGNKPGGSGRP